MTDRLETPHLSDEVIVAFVRGEIPFSEDMAAHMATCAACAGRLERAARLEEALFELAEDESVARGEGAQAPMQALVGALAAAAALWLCLTPLEGTRVESSGPMCPLHAEGGRLQASGATAPMAGGACLLPSEGEDDGGMCGIDAPVSVVPETI